MSKALLGAGLVLLLAGGLGCHDKMPDPSDERDASGRRIAVLAPAAAEMLVALDREDRVVAIGDYGPWPAALAGLPSIGGYDAPSAERLLELRVDLLVTTASDAAGDAHGSLERLGVEVLALDTSTFGGVFASLEALGRVVGRQDAAVALAAEIRGELQSIADASEDRTPRRVLFVVGRDPLFVAGPGSHVDEMIKLVGGVNVAADAAAPYQQVSLEVMLERMPEVIVDTSDNGPTALRGRTPGPWGAWEFLPAVRDDRVFWVDPGRLVIPGMRLGEMTRLLGRLVHPELFGEAAAEPGP